MVYFPHRTFYWILHPCFSSLELFRAIFFRTTVLGRGHVNKSHTFYVSSPNPLEVAPDDWSMWTCSNNLTRFVNGFSFTTSENMDEIKIVLN